MNIKLLILLMLAVMTLSACGGGNSSSGSGQSKVLIENDGVYTGTQALSVFAPDGALLDRMEFAFNLSVLQNNVTISDISFDTQAPIDSGTFVVSSGVISRNVDDVKCDLTIIYNGTIGNGAAQGFVQGQSVCKQATTEIQLSFPVKGRFDGDRGSSSSRISLINAIELDFTRIAEATRNTQ